MFVEGQELDSVVLMGPFRFRIFSDSMTCSCIGSVFVSDMLLLFGRSFVVLPVPLIGSLF